MNFFIKDFFSKCDQIRSFTEEILNEKLHFLCSDYCDDVSVKLKYLSSCDYIFNPVHFIKCLAGWHFGFRESVTVSNQNSQTSTKEISMLLDFSVLYWHIIKQLFVFVTASMFNSQKASLIADFVFLRHVNLKHKTWKIIITSMHVQTYL